MFLLVRMVLYALSGFAAGYGFAVFDGNTGQLTINVDQLASVITSGVLFLGTFIFSRVAKRRGGKT